MKRRGRPTKREEILQLNAAHRFMASLSPKPGAAEIAEQFCRPVPKERAPRAPSGRRLEKSALKEVFAALRGDPRVARVERNTSGVFRDGDRYVSVGVRGKLDLSVYLKSGRWGEIEVKRDERAKPKPHQEARISRVRAEGGFAGVAWDAESALKLLP